MFDKLRRIILQAKGKDEEEEVFCQSEKKKNFCQLKNKNFVSQRRITILLAEEEEEGGGRGEEKVSPWFGEKV